MQHRFILVCGLALLPSSYGAHAAGPGVPTLGLGYEYDLGGSREEFLLPDPLIDPSIASDHPLYVRIRAPWPVLEPQPGLYDWIEVDRVLDPYRAANFVVVLSLYGTRAATGPLTRLTLSIALSTADRPSVWLSGTRSSTRLTMSVRTSPLPNTSPRTDTVRIASGTIEKRT